MDNERAMRTFLDEFEGGGCVEGKISQRLVVLGDLTGILVRDHVGVSAHLGAVRWTARDIYPFR